MDRARARAGTLLTRQTELEVEEELWTDDGGADHAGWFCVATEPFPVPGQRLLVRRATS